MQPYTKHKTNCHHWQKIYSTLPYIPPLTWYFALALKRTHKANKSFLRWISFQLGVELGILGTSMPKMKEQKF